MCGVASAAVVLHFASGFASIRAGELDTRTDYSTGAVNAAPVMSWCARSSRACSSLREPLLPSRTSLHHRSQGPQLMTLRTMERLYSVPGSVPLDGQIAADLAIVEGCALSLPYFPLVARSVEVRCSSDSATRRTRGQYSSAAAAPCYFET